MLKIAVVVLEKEYLEGEQGIAKNIIENLFSGKSNPHVKKHRLVVRKIITRLIKKLGA
jgi:hypothetical protein